MCAVWCRLCFTHAWPGWDWLREVQLFCHCLWVVFSFIQEVPEFMENRSVCCCCCHAGGYIPCITSRVYLADRYDMFIVQRIPQLCIIFFHSLLQSSIIVFRRIFSRRSSWKFSDPVKSTPGQPHGRLSASLSLRSPRSVAHVNSFYLPPRSPQPSPHSVCAIQIEHAMWISRDMSYTHVLQHILYRRSIRY